MNEVRDFVAEAAMWLKTPEPLGVLLDREPDRVVAWLAHVLQTGGDMPRKYAAFVLGQIGAVNIVELVQEAHDSESVRGVKDAMGAALVALRVNVRKPGLTPSERREIITSMYDGKGIPGKFQ